MSKQAKIDVILNSEQAKSALKDIQEQLKQVKILRDKAAAEGNVKGFNQLNTEFKKLNTEAGKFEKQAVDINAVMKNLSGSSIRELNTAYRQTNEELKNLKRNDPGYAAKQAQVKALKDELSSANGTMGKQNITLKGLMSTVGGWAAGLGIATGAMGAVKAVIGATDSLSDKFNETIGGLTAGMSYLSRSIATLDFSNFLTNMGNAITAGREYVSTLDKIGDRTRAIGIIESNDRARLAELLIIRKDVTKTDKERIAAAKEILEIEQKNADRRKAIAKDQLDNELKYASKMTGLSQDRIGQLLIEQETNRGAIEKANAYNEALEMQRTAERISTGAGMYTPYSAQVNKPIISKETLYTIQSASPAIKQLASELKSFGKLNEDEYERIANAYKNIGEANAYYSETTAKTQVGMAKLMKGQLDDNESDVKKYTANVAKEVEKEIGSYSKLVAEIGDLEEQFRNLKASNQPIPNSLIHQIISKKGEIKEIEESVKAIGEGIALMTMKQAGEIIPGIQTQPGIILKKRNSDIGTGAPEGTDKGLDLGFKELSPQEKKNFAIEQARLTENTIFEIVANRQKAEFDQKMSQLQKQKEAELENVKLTAAEKVAINEKYAKKEAELKTEQYKKEQTAAIFKAIIETALNVVQAFPNPVAMIAAGAVGAAQIAIIKSQQPPQFKIGGYTPSNLSDNQPVGIVHANEFIGSAKAVRNPSVKKVLDIIDYAQRSGTISQINLPAVIAADASIKGHYNGGYTSAANESPRVVQPSATSIGVDPIQVIRDNNALIRHLIDKGVQTNFSLFEHEKAKAKLTDIRNAVDM